MHFKNNMKIRIIVEDRLGAGTGIAVLNVCCRIEEESDRIRIYGRMKAGEGAATPLAEPEVLCCLRDLHERILYSACSIHSGCFLINRYAVFSIEISEISRKCDWEEIDSIVLSAIYL